ncbi:MAG: cell surface protein, partial [Tannerellaceae bacterium]
VSWNDGADKEKTMDVPALVEVWRTAPYLYDGRAATMDEVLQIHGPAEKLSNDQLSELSEYVLSL